MISYFGSMDILSDVDVVQVDVPQGQACLYCKEPVEEEDSGVVYPDGHAFHRECWLRQGTGGVNHLLGLCSCCGGALAPDPEGMSRRQAAQAAMALVDSYAARGERPPAWSSP